MKYVKFKNIVVASALVVGFTLNTQVNAATNLFGSNNPTISSDLSDLTVFGTGSGDVKINSGITISSSATNRAVGFDGSSGALTNLTNNGVVLGNTYGIAVYGGSIETLTNNGTITSVSSGLYGNINTQYFGGSIGTLNNVQGGDGLSPATTALTFNSDGTGGSSPLPVNYNVIVRSINHYGQLSGSGISGSTNFGIYAGGVDGVAASTVTKGTYSAVLSGLTTSNVGITRTGTYDGYSWTLALQNGSSTIWDLIVTGASTADTQLSIHTLASKLRGGFSSQAVATNFANMNTYDCDLFDDKGLCVAIGGQQTYVDNPSSNMSSTVVVAGYKVSPTLRIGGFLNQNINNNTVSSVHMSNANPLMGLFAVWNQNEDHLGYQVKIANAYQDKDVTTTRDIIGTSEAGTGSTNLNTQSYVGELSYAFLANEDKTLVRPYAAVRYTTIKQDGYTEQTTSIVTAPLTYASLEDRSTGALLGVKLDHKLADNFHLKGSLGIEQDLYHHVDNLTATGVSGLTSENFNDNIKRTRPVASIGAYFMPVKNQRIAADIYYQQLPFQSTASTTAYVNYMIGF